MDGGSEMKLTSMDKASLFLLLLTGSFPIIYFFIDTIIPRFPIWKMNLAVIIFALTVSYWQVRLFISLFEKKEERE